MKKFVKNALNDAHNLCAVYVNTEMSASALK